MAAPRRECLQPGPAVPDRLLHVARDRDAVQHAQPLPLLPLVLFEQVLPHHGARTTRVLPRTTRPSRHVVFTARSIPLASKRGLGAHPSKIYGAAADPSLQLSWCDDDSRPLLWQGRHPVWMDGTSGQSCARPDDGVPLETLARRLRAELVQG